MVQEKIFFQFSLFFHYIYLPLEKGVALHLNNLEFPSPKNALCHVSLKLDQWFWRKIFLNFINVFALFHNYLPSEKGRALHLNKIESPSPKNALCHDWLKLAQWFWRRRWKCEKYTNRQADRQTGRQTTDDRWSEKPTWAFSSGELKTNKIGLSLSKRIFTWYTCFLSESPHFVK